MALKGTTYPNNKSDIGHTRLKQKEKKKYTNNFCQSLPEGGKEGKREKKKTIAKLFALQANAIRSQKKKTVSCTISPKLKFSKIIFI